MRLLLSLAPVSQYDMHVAIPSARPKSSQGVKEGMAAASVVRCRNLLIIATCLFDVYAMIGTPGIFNSLSSRL